MIAVWRSFPAQRPRSSRLIGTTAADDLSDTDPNLLVNKRTQPHVQCSRHPLIVGWHPTDRPNFASENALVLMNR